MGMIADIANIKFERLGSFARNFDQNLDRGCGLEAINNLIP